MDNILAHREILCTKLFRIQFFGSSKRLYKHLKNVAWELFLFFTSRHIIWKTSTSAGEAPLKCKMCDETFRRHSNLIQHRNRHHLNIKKKVKDYVCVCGDVFHSKKKLEWHKETHEAKPKSCNFCSEKFIHMASLTRHMRRAHNEHYIPEQQKEHAQNVQCTVCSTVVSSYCR